MKCKAVHRFKALAIIPCQGQVYVVARFNVATRFSKPNSMVTLLPGSSWQHESQAQINGKAVDRCKAATSMPIQFHLYNWCSCVQIEGGNHMPNPNASAQWFPGWRWQHETKYKLIHIDMQGGNNKPTPHALVSWFQIHRGNKMPSKFTCKVFKLFPDSRVQQEAQSKLDCKRYVVDQGCNKKPNSNSSGTKLLPGSMLQQQNQSRLAGKLCRGSRWQQEAGSKVKSQAVSMIKMATSIKSQIKVENCVMDQGGKKKRSSQTEEQSCVKDQGSNQKRKSTFDCKAVL